MPETKKILIIEMTGSHFEWLYSQASMLSGVGHELLIAVPREQTGRLKDIDCRVLPAPLGGSSVFSQLVQIYQWLKIIKKEKINLIIFNTAHNIAVRNLLLFLPGKVRRAGFLHRGQNLLSSRNQSMITQRIDAYFVMADYQAKNLSGLTTKPLFVLYNLHFKSQKSISKGGSDKFNIIIPGNVEAFRRDSLFLIEEIVRNEPISNCRFIFLGKLDRSKPENLQMLKLLESYKHKENIVIFFDFVSDKEYNDYMEQADLLLPLIHPTMDNFENYLKYQISGTFNLSYAYGVPMLMEKSFAVYKEFQLSSIFYTKEQILDRIDYLSKHRDELNTIKEEIINNPVWQFDYQKGKYREYIGKLLNQKISLK